MACNCCCSLCMSLESSSPTLAVSPLTGLSTGHCRSKSCFSMWTRHLTHFFINGAHTSQAQTCSQGRNSTEALRSLHTRHSSSGTRSSIAFLQTRHFLQRRPQLSHAATWLHGLNSTSRLLSEQIKHSSGDLLEADKLDIPTVEHVVCLLNRVSLIFSWHNDSVTLNFSLKCLFKTLVRFLSEQRSMAVWFFLFLMLMSAPLWISKQAMLIEEALSTVEDDDDEHLLARSVKTLWIIQT